MSRIRTLLSRRQVQYLLCEKFVYRCFLHSTLIVRVCFHDPCFSFTVNKIDWFFERSLLTFRFSVKTVQTTFISFPSFFLFSSTTYFYYQYKKLILLHF